MSLEDGNPEAADVRKVPIALLSCDTEVLEKGTCKNEVEACYRKEAAAEKQNQGTHQRLEN